MNYQWHYDRLMERARIRELTGYAERHHVVPRCLGGSNSRTNLVRLTPEEHYVAHQLLVKMHPGHKGLIWSAMAMTNKTAAMARSNRRYGWLRRKFAERVSVCNLGLTRTPETRAKLRAAKLGRSYAEQGREITEHTPETKAKMSCAAKGRKKSPEHCAALSKAKLGNQNALGHRLSDEVKSRIAEAKGRLPIEEMVKLPLSRLSRQNRRLVKTYRQLHATGVMTQ